MAAWIYKGGQQYFKSGLRGSGSTLAKTGSMQYLLDFTATLAAGVGNNTTSFDGIAHFVMKGAALTSTAMLNAAVHGVYWITGTNASTWPKAAMIGEVHDSTTSADAAVVALVGGDSGQVTATSAFAVMTMNSAGSVFTYGLDLSPAAISPYPRVNYVNADIRMSGDIVLFSAAGVPSNGVAGTGAGFAGPGSIYVNRSTGIPYSNTNTKASPTWTKTSGT